MVLRNDNLILIPFLVLSSVMFLFFMGLTIDPLPLIPFFSFELLVFFCLWFYAIFFFFFLKSEKDFVDLWRQIPKIKRTLSTRHQNRAKACRQRYNFFFGEAILWHCWFGFYCKLVLVFIPIAPKNLLVEPFNNPYMMLMKPKWLG